MLKKKCIFANKELMLVSMNRIKNVYRVFVCISVVISLITCKNENGTHTSDNRIEFDSLQVTKKSYLNNDTTQPFCKVTVYFIYPKTAEKSDLKHLQRLFVENMLGYSYAEFSPPEAVNRYIAHCLENYRHDAETFSTNLSNMKFMETLLPDYSDSLSYSFYSYFETLSDTIYFNKGNILSFQVKQSSNKGGAMPDERYKNYVINLKTGKLLAESDIFKPGYERQLQLLFISSFMKQNGVKTIHELEDLGYFGIEEMRPNKNFLINDKGITYTFNKGEYSAYPLPEPVIFLPYETIRSILRENTVVSTLAGK